MTKKRVDGRGPAFATGSLRKPREDLVAWPSDSSPALEAAPVSIDPEESEDTEAQLARAKQEIRRLLARVKCNLAPAVPTLAARFTSAGPDAPLQVEWLGEDDRTAADILKEMAEARSGGDEDRSGARRALVDWLRDGDWKAVKQLQAMAGPTGMSWKAFEKMKGKLGLATEHRPGIGWCWRDPYAPRSEGE